MRRLSGPLPWLAFVRELDSSEMTPVLELTMGYAPNGPASVNVEYDPRTGIAYTSPEEALWLDSDDIDELGLGPDGENL